MRFEKIKKEPPHRWEEDKGVNCVFRRFWNAWGAHIDAASILAILGGLTTVIWMGFNFVRDTQAYAGQIHSVQMAQTAQRHDISLTAARQDRMDGNLQLLMQKLGVKPLKKTETERMLELQQVTPSPEQYDQ